MVRRLRQHWPLLAALGVYWIIVAGLIAFAIKLSEGSLVYPLDDTYIHMAIAKNWARHRVWGVTQYGFASATSSPLWTILLAVTYAMFGVNEVAPLVLNIGFGSLVVVALYLILRKYAARAVFTFVVLLVAIFATPLPTLTLAGMEHTLHGLLTVTFVYACSAVLAAKQQPGRGMWLLVATAPLLTIARYEGIFLLLIAGALLVLRRRLPTALLVGLLGMTPVLAYGFWSRSHGWPFLPNSVLLKAGVLDFSLAEVAKLGKSFALYAVDENTHVLMLLVASLILVLAHLKDESPWSARRLMNVAFVAATLCHMQFAKIGWLYRYEAYLVLLGILVIGVAASDITVKIPSWKLKRGQLASYALAALLILLIGFPFGRRALASLVKTPQSSRDRYLEHIQPARFVARYYNDATVMANDIGALTYFTDARILDMYGLGSREPYLFRQKQDGYTRRDVLEWARQESVAIAILQVQWPEVRPRIPDEWELVGLWQVPQNVVFLDTNIGMLAVNPREKPSLVRHLKAFAAEMPPSIRQSGEYTE